MKTTHAERIKAVIEAAKQAPRRVAAIIDEEQEKLYVEKFTEALPEFDIEVLGSPIEGQPIKTIILTRKKARDVSLN